MSQEMLFLKNDVELLRLINDVRKEHGLHSLDISLLRRAALEANNYLLNDSDLPAHDSEMSVFTTSLVLLKISKPAWWDEVIRPTLIEAVYMLENEGGDENCRLHKQIQREELHPRRSISDSELALRALLAIHRPE